ncbi:MAG: leucyl aminopeptidase [Holosporales bacterium]|jgi:leucyl aminopeptidase|nr:leucyl aminopeptidase [Holosporales bacterium]
MVDIFFKAPDKTLENVIVGEFEERLLSSSLTLSKAESDFLRKKREKCKEECKEKCKKNKEVCFHQFSRSLNEIGNLLLLRVARLTSLEMTETEAQELGAKIFVAASACKEEEILVDFSSVINPTLVAHIALGFKIRSFSFDKYKTKNKDENKIKSVYFISSNNKITSQCFSDLIPIADALEIVRTLSLEAPNVLYPEIMAKVAKDLKQFGIKTEILEEKEMKKLGMEALLSVGQGSAHDSYMAVCQWNGGKSDEAPIAIVGKGVTFDSGGISIKPSHNMHEMKEDMTGAAIVLSTMQMIASLKLPINVVGVVGLVENMPSGSAVRPSDIVYSMSGQTIEIQNTDAEGRLVLADALFYVSEQFKPQCIIDFATLTGAIQVALGQEFAGLFSNNDHLSELLLDAGKQVKERLWRLPLDPAFDKDIDSDIADVRNVGAGRGAGSITAAQFLQRFIQETPWAHIDIAAVTLDSKERLLTGSGFTGFGVRLMHAFLNEVIKKRTIFYREEK